MFVFHEALFTTRDTGSCCANQKYINMFQQDLNSFYASFSPIRKHFKLLTFINNNLLHFVDFLILHIPYCL